MTDRTFAERLQRAIDRDPELTPAGLATKAGLSNSVVRKILAGITKNPRVDTAILICRALGTTLEDFMSGAFEGTRIDEDEEDQRIRDLLSQLSIEERRLLLGYAEGLRDARDKANEEPPQDDQ